MSFAMLRHNCFSLALSRLRGHNSPYARWTDFFTLSEWQQSFVIKRFVFTTEAVDRYPLL